MDRVTLKLKRSTLKGIVALCYVTGESLRRTFEYEHLEPHERRDVFARWNQVTADALAGHHSSSLPLMALVTIFVVLQYSNLVYSLIFNDWSFTYRRTIK
jgi:hypothetical protein